MSRYEPAVAAIRRELDRIKATWRASNDHPHSMAIHHLRQQRESLFAALREIEKS